jgi:hypothetical protein
MRVEKHRPSEQSIVSDLSRSTFGPQPPTNPHPRRGTAKVCGKDNNVLATRQGQDEASSCTRDRAGNAYLCSDYSPRPMAEDWSYAFVITEGAENCCKCFELTWEDGPARGKRLVTQVINTGGKEEAGVRDWIVLTPGGGVGPNTAGCNSQFGYDW